MNSFISLYTLSLLLINLLSPASALEEICDNAMDDDGDHLIDLNDPDCLCDTTANISLLPNPSFEETDCCPEAENELHCARHWLRASEPSTDFIHTCGFIGWQEFMPPLPFPDGDGIVGFRSRLVEHRGTLKNYKEYAGTCLLAPLQADTTYRFQFYLGFPTNYPYHQYNVHLFGATLCDSLPFGGTDQFYGCPTNGPGWVKLGSMDDETSHTGWEKQEIIFTPDREIHAIAIGPDCGQQEIYAFLDGLVLEEARSISFREIMLVGEPCSENSWLEIPYDPVITYQWYLDGVALVGETGHQLLERYGPGTYQVRMLDGSACRITQAYQLYSPNVYETTAQAAICAGETYSFGTNALTAAGTYTDTLTAINQCDSIVTLSLSVIAATTDTLRVSTLAGESYVFNQQRYTDPGTYPISLSSELGCDSTIVLILEQLQLYFPNAFSPNNDGINDYFNGLASQESFQIQDLQVFNRWGALVYRDENIAPGLSSGWNGKFHGKLVDPGVYVYVATVRLHNDTIKQYTGSVVVVR